MTMQINLNEVKQTQVQKWMQQPRHAKEQCLPRQTRNYLKSQWHRRVTPHAARRQTKHTTLKMLTKRPDLWLVCRSEVTESAWIWLVPPLQALDWPKLFRFFTASASNALKKWNISKTPIFSFTRTLSLLQIDDPIKVISSLSFVLYIAFLCTLLSLQLFYVYVCDEDLMLMHCHSYLRDEKGQ